MEKISFDPNLEFYAMAKSIVAAVTSDTPASMQVPREKDFWVAALTFYNGGAAAGDLAIKFSIAGKDNSFVDSAIKTDCIFGDGKQPFELPVATRVAAGSTINLTITNSTATSRTVQVVLIGYRCPSGYMPTPFVDQVNKQLVNRGINR